MSLLSRVLAVALGLVLIAPASSAAQEVVFGSPLTAEPAGLDCETRPRPLGGAPPFESLPVGFLIPTPSGTPDCSWFPNGVVGPTTPGDPRTVTVPADGTITKISVRSGPTPAPIRFVVARIRNGVCCSFVGETELMRPTPNAITSFAVAIPVRRGVDGGAAIEDVVGVSAVTGTGSLPLHVTGRNAPILQQPGDANARAIYPRMSAASPNPAQLDNDPGVEVLMQLTFCPASQPCVPPTQGVAGIETAAEIRARDEAGPRLRLPRFKPRAFRTAPRRDVASDRVAGTVLRVSLNEAAATVRIAIQHRLPGRRSSGRCVAPRAKSRKAKRCIRFVGRGTVVRNNVAAGTVAIPFDGRVNGKALVPGRYRTVVVASDELGNQSRPRKPRFRIVR